MQTECPHCHTLFRVTETQLEMADGMVRCGFCKEVFDARPADRIPDDGKEAAPDEREQEKIAPVVRDITPATDSLRTEESLDAIEIESAAGSDARSYSMVATAAWSVAILSLIVLLVAEYLWFNQPELLRYPGLEPITARLCDYTQCDHLQKRDPALIEMVSRNVYSHPNEKEALMVSTTIANRAPFAQPYPDVQLDFSNVRGRLVASRRFRPQEYLQTDASGIGLLESGKTAAFALEIRDPGTEAITYEFSFH